ncbi:RHS repeat-associated core domain-containing protein, partial [Flavobacterium sp.]|uniref:RHS repeat-associated core domain-containing protein n=1 Tax=Flavobacterium sp. TaxID=239 RepID=UPI003412FD33
MGCLQLHNYTTLRIAHTSNTARSREGKSDAGLYKYKLNGNEWQDELGLNLYDMNARQYDPSIGRFTSVDPLAEVQPNKTPYHFVSNNPINRVDPTGMLDNPIYDTDGNF